MQRTGEAAMITTYGPTAAAQARVDMVTRMHRRVSGTTPEGQAYAALEPELMTWVHLTAGYGFLSAYLRHVEPGLSRADQDRYYAEGARMGEAFGAVDPPRSAAEAEAWMLAMRPKLRPHPIIGEFLKIVSTTSPLGFAGRALQPLVVQAAIDLLPDWTRRELALPVSRSRRRMAQPLLSGLARLAKAAPGEIPRQAYARMGRNPPA